MLCSQGQCYRISFYRNTFEVTSSFHDVTEAGTGNTPVTRRERQRKTSERQRGTSTSTLAASVGLQCPLTPSGIRDGGSADWHAGERLSQANLDGIVFPGVLLTGSGDEAAATGSSEPLVTDRQIRQSLSDSTIFEDTEKNLFRPRGFSLETIGGPLKHQNVSRSLSETTTPASQPIPPPISPDWSRTAPSPPSNSHSTLHQKLLSLRISESSLFSSTDQQHFETGASQEDEVFLQNPPCPSPPKSPSSVEDFPPPPPSNLDQEAGHQARGRFVLTCAHSSKVRTRLWGCCINYLL